METPEKRIVPLEDLDVELAGGAPDRLEDVVPDVVDPTTAPKLYDSSIGDHVLDLAVRLAQGDLLDGFKRSDAGVLAEVGVSLSGDPEKAVDVLDAYSSVWEDER